MEKSRLPKDYSKQATDPKKSKESSQEEEEEEEEDGRVRKKTLVSFPSGNALSLSVCPAPFLHLRNLARINLFKHAISATKKSSPPPHQTRRSRTSFSSRHFDSPKREKIVAEFYFGSKNSIRS
jgi:hypothetical protein